LLGESSGIFGGLQVDRFLSDTAAVVPGSEVARLLEGDESAAAEESKAPTLLESTVPIRTEDRTGELEAVDLSLERVFGGALRPANPLVEVLVPGELGEGISLPE